MVVVGGEDSWRASGGSPEGPRSDPWTITNSQIGVHGSRQGTLSPSAANDAGPNEGPERLVYSLRRRWCRLMCPLLRLEDTFGKGKGGPKVHEPHCLRAFWSVRKRPD